MNPNIAMIGNALLGIWGVLESTGVINVVTSSGGKAGAIAATVVAAVNVVAHGYSTAQPGPLASTTTSKSS